jgi:hypothetical protein
MYKKILGLFIVMALMLGACSFVTISSNSVVGSGNVIRERRGVSGFTSVMLLGSAHVEVTFGVLESVNVEADDNIVPLVETVVKNGQLVISNKSNANFTSFNPVRVNVTMKSLKEVTLSGSGNINISEIGGDTLKVNLPGSGSLSVTGSATTVNISLPGSGNIYCNRLIAKSATVALNGSGNIEVFNMQNLDARVRGSGTIHYGGNPAQVSKNISGSGSIMP